MIFDIRPFWLVGALCFAGSGLLVLVVKNAYQRELAKVISVWGAANIILGVAFALRFERPWVGQFLFYDLAGALMTLCLSLEYLGVSWLKHQKPRLVWIAAPPSLVLAVTTWFTFVHRNISIALIFCNCANLVLLALLAVILTRKEQGRRPYPDVIAACAYGGLSTVTFLVIVDAVRSGVFPLEYDFFQLRGVANAIAAIVTEAIVFPMFLMMVSERLNRSLVELAMCDSLTGLYNRRAFKEIAVREMAGAARTRLPLSVVLFDLDRFKSVNDTLGHAAGDAVLIKAAAAIRQSLREEDFLCRWGGDEFCALMPRAGWEQAEKAAERVKLAFEKSSFEIEGKVFSLGVSIGIASDDPPSGDISGLIRQADADLYREKKEKRGAVEAAALGAGAAASPAL
jgi:diguanylate cyclase (GGDEF)-like protein